MLTRCPQCETIFKVSKKHISAAKGLVRCGSCKDIFNAKEHVIKSKKDLKKVVSESKQESKPELKPESKIAVTATLPNTKTVQEKSPLDNQPVVNAPVSKSEPDSFDFLSHGFSSTTAREKFDLTTPPKQTNQNKKPTSKADALERGQTTNINFDSIFNDTTTTETQKEVTVSSSKTAKFKSKTLQPHKATVVKPVPEKKPSIASSFISQNVIEIKNAFSSISKKITTKVANKIQLPKRQDETDNSSLPDSSNTVKQPSPVSSELTLAILPDENSESLETQKKPTVVSLTNDTESFTLTPKKTDSKTAKSSETVTIAETTVTAPKKITATEPTPTTSKPTVKEKPKLKEDAALKLAIQLKKAALEKTQLPSNATATEKKSAPQDSLDTRAIADNKPNIEKQPKPDTKLTEKIKKIKEIEESNLNIVQSASEKPTDNIKQTQEPKPKLQLVEPEPEAVAEKKAEQQAQSPVAEVSKKTDDKPVTTDSKKTTPKESKLIPKEESKPKDDSDDSTEVPDDTQLHIHIENGDIPMVLRESLEELDLPSRSTEMTLFMIVSLVLLSLGLLLQFSVFRSIEVQQEYPALKPFITKICESFVCGYNGPRDIKKIQLINRDIRVHPNTKGALLISATIINNANFQQPYPNFSVRLSNLSGKTVAQRFFSPNDYLGKLSNELLLMPSKQPIRVSLEVVDPGKEAINFEFKFLSIR